ncbi:MAG: 50S ribosomal protein L15 [Fimbriimonadales bacterium]|jgi:large subunit ribosomal protein L15|nr:MAG: 50S ribosomal protein L15 [Fimbriimonadales bacterium]
MSKIHLLGNSGIARKKKRRVGRGIGSGSGKTAGRGTKGQKSRSTINPRFEGGQTPIHRRLPVKKGFRNPNHIEYAVLNVGVLDRELQDGDELTPERARELGLVGNMKDGLKILGHGELSKKLTVKAHAFSRTAVEKIEKAGGEVVRL